jgi:TPR repeat protein
MYENGEGTKPDRVLAFVWFLIAARRENQDAIRGGELTSFLDDRKVDGTGFQLYNNGSTSAVYDADGSKYGGPTALIVEGSWNNSDLGFARRSWCSSVSIAVPVGRRSCRSRSLSGS